MRRRRPAAGERRSGSERGPADRLHCLFRGDDDQVRPGAAEAAIRDSRLRVRGERAVRVRRVGKDDAVADPDVEAADDRVLFEPRLERVVRRGGLGERVADRMAVIVAARAVPLARRLLVAYLAALHLEDEDAEFRVGDDEVRLPARAACPAARVSQATL